MELKDSFRPVLPSLNQDTIMCRIWQNYNHYIMTALLPNKVRVLGALKVIP